MNTALMQKLRIGDLEIEKPIIQGGMGVGVSLSGLSTAVANEGGVGVISSVGLGLLKPIAGKDYNEANVIALRDEIRKARANSNGVLGLNIMVALTAYDELVKLGLDEKVDILFLGAGLPIKLPKTLSVEDLQKTRTKLIPIVSSGRAANLIFKAWEKNFDRIPDGVVVEGPKAGGHLGFKPEQIENPEFELEKLIPDVISTLKPFGDKYGKKIPVIAAGGIYSGADIYKFLQLGADGVQMGTRFVATDECDASAEFKQQYVNCEKNEIVIIKSPVGLPGRAINNGFLEDVSAGMKKPYKCPIKCLKTCDCKSAPYCIALALVHAQKGNLKHGFSFSGANAYKVKEIVSVKKLMSDLECEYEEAVINNSSPVIKYAV